MFGSKSNIFVSISPGYEYAKGEHKLYLKPHYVWMLTVESASHSLSGRRDPNPTHYSVVWNDYTESFEIRKVRPTNQGIVGSIEIQRHAPASAAKLFDLLQNALEAHDPTFFSSEFDGSEESESWMRQALQELQDDKIVKAFDVELFMSFAQAYLDRRIAGEGPARIAYSRHHKDHSQKEKKSFWVSYPQMHANYDRSDVYGGLM